MSDGINGRTDGDRIVEYSQLDVSIQELIQAAREVRNNAHCPYSKFPVGAALRLANGQIIAGCNVENATFGPSICAERTAVAHAVSLGQREFTAVAVVAYQEHSFTAPCGVCRQTLAEFAKPTLPVYMAKPAPCRVLCATLGELLPYAFEATFKDEKSTNIITAAATEGGAHLQQPPAAVDVDDKRNRNNATV